MYGIGAAPLNFANAFAEKSIVNLPKIEPKNYPTEVYVFDNFRDKVVPINPEDSTPDASHGQVVSMILRSKLPANTTLHEVDVSGQYVGVDGDAVCANLKDVIARECVRQKCAADKLNLSHLKFNFSFGMTKDETGRLNTMKFMGERGATFFIARGNDDEDPGIPLVRGLRGVHVVDGSDGVVGQQQNTKRSDLYFREQGNSRFETTNSILNPVVTRSKASPNTVSVDVNADGKADASLTLTPSFTDSFSGVTLKAARAGIAEIRAISVEIAAIRLRATDEETANGPMRKFTAADQKRIDQLLARRSELRKVTLFTSKELVEFELINPGKEANHVATLTKSSRGGDALIAINGDALNGSYTNLRFYESNNGRIQTRSEPINSFGTSWATPELLGHYLRKQ
jgi:hypothetical protein